MSWTLYGGDCLALLSTLEENDCDAIVTDPPYELQLMGQAWDQSGISFQPDTWKALLRVIKPGGHLLAFGAARTSHRMVCAIEDAGWEIRDTLYYVYGTGWPKSPHALKPAVEPIVLARKPLSEPTLEKNIVRWGTGSLQTERCRIPVPSNPSQSRWPAHLLHDGSSEVLDLFPETKSGAGNVKRKSAKGFTPRTFGKESRPEGQVQVAYGDRGNASRVFYCAKPNAAERGKMPKGELPLFGQGTVPMENIHTTIKPLALLRYLCRLVTPPGGIIFDPFCGSGTTGCAALQEGLSFVGIEKEEAYATLARHRLAQAIKE